MLSNLRTGQVVALDDSCWSGFIQTMADQLRPGPQEGAPGEALAGAEAAEEAAAGPNPPRPKRGRQGRQNGSGALTSEASPFPDPEPAES